MDERELEIYQKLSIENRGTSRQVGWSISGQTKRFEAIVKIMFDLVPSWKEKKLLDFGCGRGDLLRFLTENYQFKGSYYGIDGTPTNIEDAQTNLVNYNGKFELLNWNESISLIENDLVLINGAFGYTLPASRNKMFLTLLEQSNIGVICTFLKRSALIKTFENNIFTSIEEILSLIDHDKYKIILRTDYLPHDFAIGVIKR